VKFPPASVFMETQFLTCLVIKINNKETVSTHMDAGGNFALPKMKRVGGSLVGFT